MNKYQYSTNTIYYQKARFFRKAGSNEFAYCIEPFQFFNDSASYESTITPNNLTTDQIARISKIAHYGYGYKNHSDIKWYAITQMMIWQTADPNSGDYYFTDSLNGNRISPYDNEINEINTLVNNHDLIPSFSNQTFDTVSGYNIDLTDNNGVINNYIPNSQDSTISNNTLSIKTPEKEGSYEYTFSKQDNNYNKPFIFYQANNSQNLIETGDLNTITAKVTINVINTYIQITKIDEDTNSITPSGEGILDNAIYKLYDSNMKEIKTLTIKNNQALIKNLQLGKYYLKEDKPGTGYTINNQTYEINITKESHKINQTVKNKVIEKKIIIKKKYGEENTLMNEANIQFDIFNSKNEYLKTITTNEEGIAEVTLPYGEYTFIQKNTSDGYEKVEPLKIKVDNSEEEIIELKDLKIPVPNTHTNSNKSALISILILLCEIIY